MEHLHLILVIGNILQLLFMSILILSLLQFATLSILFTLLHSLPSLSFSFTLLHIIPIIFPIFHKVILDQRSNNNFLYLLIWGAQILLFKSALSQQTINNSSNDPSITSKGLSFLTTYALSEILLHPVYISFWGCIPSFFTYCLCLNLITSQF